MSCKDSPATGTVDSSSSHRPIMLCSQEFNLGILNSGIHGVGTFLGVIRIGFGSDSQFKSVLS